MKYSFIIESPFLASLHENFLSLVERHPVKLLSFGEKVPMKLSWMLQTVLVTNDSAGKQRSVVKSGFQYLKAHYLWTLFLFILIPVRNKGMIRL